MPKNEKITHFWCFLLTCATAIDRAAITSSRNLNSMVLDAMVSTLYFSGSFLEFPLRKQGRSGPKSIYTEGTHRTPLGAVVWPLGWLECISGAIVVLRLGSQQPESTRAAQSHHQHHRRLGPQL